VMDGRLKEMMRGDREVATVVMVLGDGGDPTA